MYNKNQFKKVNDKKVLHKIKKHWAVISVALLGLLGGGAVTTTNVSANTTTQNNNDNQANHSLNTNQQSQQPKLVNDNLAKNTQSSLNNSPIHKNNDLSNTSKRNNIVTKSINQQASQLHSRIINKTIQKFSDGYSSNTSINHKNPHMLLGKRGKSPIITGIHWGTAKGTFNKRTGELHFSDGTLASDHRETINSDGYFIKAPNPNESDSDSDIETLFGSGLDNLYTLHNGKKKSFDSDMLTSDGSSDLLKSITFSNCKAPENSSYLFATGEGYNGSPDGPGSTGLFFTSINLSGLDTSNVTNMSNMFYADSDLQTINGLSDINTSNVTNMSSMFSGDTSLKSLNVSNFDTKNVTNMSGMFDCHFYNGLLNGNAPALNNIYGLSDFNTKNVENMSHMFASDSHLKSIDLKSFNTNNVTNMSGMFASDGGLKELSLGSDTKLNKHGQDWGKSIIGNFGSFSRIPFFQNNVDANGNNSTLEILNGTQPAGTYYYGKASTEPKFPDNNASNKIKLQIEHDYYQENTDVDNEFNDVNNEINIYSDIDKEILDYTNNNDSLYESELDSLSNNDSLAFANYSSESANITQLFNKLGKRSPLGATYSTNTSHNREHRLLGSIPIATSSNSTLSLPSKDKSLYSLNSKLASLASMGPLEQFSNKVIQSIGNNVKQIASEYSNTHKQEEEASVQASSEDSTAVSLNNQIGSLANTNNPNDFDKIQSLENNFTSNNHGATSYQNERKSLGHKAYSLDSQFNQIASQYASSTSSYIKNLSSNPHQYNKSVAPASTSSAFTKNAKNFVNSEEELMSSIASQTNVVASSANSINNSDTNTKTINSYNISNSNLSKSVNLLGSNYLSNVDIASNNYSRELSDISAASSEEAIAKSANDISNGTQSISSLANSAGTQAGLTEIKAHSYEMSIPRVKQTMSLLSNDIYKDISSANNNYQSAQQLLVSISSASSKVAPSHKYSGSSSSNINPNSVATKTQSQSASLSASTSASLSNSIQSSIAISQYNSSVNKSNSIQASLSTSASISNSIANSIATSRETQMNTNISPQSNSQSSLVTTTPSNSSTAYIPSSSNSNSSMSSSTDITQSKPASSSNPTNQDSSDNDNNDDSDMNDGDNSPKTDNNTQPSDTNRNESQQDSTAGISDTHNQGQGEQQNGITDNSTPTVNNGPINSTNDTGNNQNNSNEKLPQTNETSSKGREAAEISLIMSTTLGALGMYIDKRRHDNN